MTTDTSNSSSETIKASRIISISNVPQNDSNVVGFIEKMLTKVIANPIDRPNVILITSDSSKPTINLEFPTMDGYLSCCCIKTLLYIDTILYFDPSNVVSKDSIKQPLVMEKADYHLLCVDRIRIPSTISSSTIRVSKIPRILEKEDIFELFEVFGTFKNPIIHYNDNSSSIDTIDITYSNKDSAFTASQILNNYKIGNSNLSIQVINENDMNSQTLKTSDSQESIANSTFQQSSSLNPNGMSSGLRSSSEGNGLSHSSTIFPTVIEDSYERNDTHSSRSSSSPEKDIKNNNKEITYAHDRSGSYSSKPERPYHSVSHHSHSHSSRNHSHDHSYHSHNKYDDYYRTNDNDNNNRNHSRNRSRDYSRNRSRESSHNRSRENSRDYSHDRYRDPSPDYSSHYYKSHSHTASHDSNRTPYDDTHSSSVYNKKTNKSESFSEKNSNYNDMLNYSSSRIIMLKNILTDSDIENETERMDIIADIQSTCSSYGRVVRVLVPKINESGAHSAIIEFDTHEDAETAISKLRTQAFNKTVIKAKFVDIENYINQRFDD